ncbi:hypothetical protein [Pseudophaeobacter arcticus]|uniref:hypothetical protein n=1 Tax=Pseudophaeobacter arcticus TaxID=385492 RepID=UPI003A96BF14
MICKKTLHFHIGSHKTATTTLQNALAANEDLLAGAGLLYPKSGRYFTGHHPLALQLRDPALRDQPLETLGDWPALLREIQASPADHVLLSSENFEWLQDLSRLQGLSRHYRVRVLFYMRSPAGYLESFYNQLVKDLKTRESRPLESYICEHGLFFLDNDRLLRRWSETFGAQALQVRLYDRSGSAETLVSRFLSALGCQSQPRLLLPQEAALQKVSLPPDALEYLRLRNLYRAPSTGQHRITMSLAQIAQAGAGAGTGARTGAGIGAGALQRTRAGLLSLAAQQNLIRRFAEGNRRVARAYLGADRAPFDPDQARAHADFDQRLPVGDDVMISRVEALLSRFAKTAPAPADAVDPAHSSQTCPNQANSNQASSNASSTDFASSDVASPDVASSDPTSSDAATRPPSALPAPPLQPPTG